ncbi:4'-phosphopantetheinyl transferase [Rathayibacter sp. PhB179]|nr:4'-phosphopantetheinyl transferase [Rathayibacter sp. PhB192]TCM30192.1 4'-phosphopantetheinyl transferase [Rathayibacter sp. PhB179]
MGDTTVGDGMRNDDGVRDLPGVHLRWLALDEQRLDAERLLPLLGTAERERYRATGSAAVAERFVFGRVLLRMLAGELLGLPASMIRVTARCSRCGGPHGRPWIEGAEHLSVSIAHCPGAVVVAASSAGVVGVDVEPVAGPPERGVAITRIAGAPFATGGFRAADPILHWTRIEAALKADGRGLDVDPRRVRIHESRFTAEARIDSSRFRLAEPHLDPSLRVSVALGDSVGGAGPIIGWRREHGDALEDSLVSAGGR